MFGFLARIRLLWLTIFAATLMLTVKIGDIVDGVGGEVVDVVDEVWFGVSDDGRVGGAFQRHEGLLDRHARAEAPDLRLDDAEAALDTPPGLPGGR